MPRSSTYVTKVQELTAVVLQGRLELVDPAPHDPDVFSEWRLVGDYGGNGKDGKHSDRYDRLEEWLDRFAGQEVTISIKTYERDESHLLPPEEQSDG